MAIFHSYYRLAPLGIHVGVLRVRRVEEPDDDGVPVGVEEVLHKLSKNMVLHVGGFGERELLRGLLVHHVAALICSRSVDV